VKGIVIFGNNNVAEMIHMETQKLTDSSFTVDAFCVDREYLNSDSYCGKPLISFEKAIEKYPPHEYDMLSTVLASSNGLRKKMEVFNRLKKAGYGLLNYISPLSDISDDIQMGENNIIFSHCRVGLNVKIGNANMLWHGVLLDHDSVVGDGNFFAGGCKTAGSVKVGNSCWIGINSTIIQQIAIADETLIGAGCVVVKDTEPFTTYVGNPAKAIKAHKEEGIIVR